MWAGLKYETQKQTIRMLGFAIASPNPPSRQFAAL
jgi:hypothetical protein